MLISEQTRRVQSNKNRKMVTRSIISYNKTHSCDSEKEQGERVRVNGGYRKWVHGREIKRIK